MESDNYNLRTLTAIVAGALASLLTIAFFIFAAWAIFVFLAATISFESGGTLALGIDILCIAPLALFTFIPVGVFTGKFVHGRLTRLASTKGSHAEKRVSLFIFGIAGVIVFLATVAFIIS